MSISEDEKNKDSADLVVYGKIFTSENDRIVEAFAVHDGRYVYAGDKKGAEAFIEDGRTEILDYTEKGLVMPSCGNGHAHYSMGYALQSVGTIVILKGDRPHCGEEGEGERGNDCIWLRMELYAFQR